MSTTCRTGLVQLPYISIVQDLFDFRARDSEKGLAIENSKRCPIEILDDAVQRRQKSKAKTKHIWKFCPSVLDWYCSDFETPKGCFIDCMIELFLILLVSFRWLRLWFHCQKEVTTILTLKEEIIDMQSKIQSRELNSKSTMTSKNTKFESVYGYYMFSIPTYMCNGVVGFWFEKKNTSNQLFSSSGIENNFIFSWFGLETSCWCWRDRKKPSLLGKN